MSPLQIDCIVKMRDGWRMSSDLLLRSPLTSYAPSVVVRRQTVNALHRRGLIETNPSGYWVLTEDGKNGMLIKDKS